MKGRYEKVPGLNVSSNSLTFWANLKIKTRAIFPFKWTLVFFDFLSVDWLEICFCWKFVWFEVRIFKIREVRIFFQICSKSIYNSNKETFFFALTFVNFYFSMASDCENRSGAKKRREKIDSARPIQIQEMFAITDDLNQFESEICLRMRNLSMWQVDSYSEILKKCHFSPRIIGFKIKLELEL